MLKRIALMTSGGDSPGMNAAIRAVVLVAMQAGTEVWGICDGYAGLCQNRMVKLTSEFVHGILQQGGTVLGTTRCEEFCTPEGRIAAKKHLDQRGIEGVVIIGGDGSMRGAQLLAQQGILVVGLPGTIDNDIWGTDNTIGFDTAINTAVEAIQKLCDTAASHGRVILIEVMGHNSGLLAMNAGLAVGADEILIPEIEFDVPEICQKLRQSHGDGKQYSVIVVAEGAGSGTAIGDEIARGTGLNTIVSVPGYLQRGGAPSVWDRILATMLGEAAAKALLAGSSQVMFGYHKGTVVAIDLAEAIDNKKTIDTSLLKLNKLLSQ